jgi:transcriptional regulator with XRE-family HTH domain
VTTGAELRDERARTNRSLAQAAEALNAWPIKLSRLERGLDHDTEMAARYLEWLQAA